MHTPYNPAAPIKEMFKQISETNNLTMDAISPYQNFQLVNIGYDLVFCAIVLNDACQTLKHLPDANQTWAHFKTQFTAVHDEKQEMQTATQELSYATANFSAIGPTDYNSTAAEALQALAKATTEDRTAVANLPHTNGLLNKQVVNLMKTITMKETEIEELYKSTSKLSYTIHNLVPNSENCGSQGGQEGQGTAKGHNS
eukprot:11536487-Ditylum_brightwellii.AAC.1